MTKADVSETTQEHTWNTDVFDIPAGRVSDFYIHWDRFTMVKRLQKDIYI